MTSEVQIPEYEYTYDEITNEDKVISIQKHMKYP